MLRHRRQSNIIDFRRKKYLNIGIVIFGIIFIYLIVTIVMYLNAPRILPYEVREGSILRDTSYTGFALRSETVVHSDKAGYINYYVPDCSKVHAGMNIYTLSSEQLQVNDTPSDAVVLSDEQIHTLQLKMQGFSEHFIEREYSDTYLFKNDIVSSLQSITNKSRLEQLNEIINSGEYPELSLYPSSDDGIVIYSVDGLEGITKDNLTLEHLDRSNYHYTEFSNNSEIQTQDPVYKLITDDAWSLVTEITQDTFYQLKDKKYVKILFEKDKQTIWADLELQEKDGHMLAFLYMKDSMIRYANERFINFEMILEDESGLKIPKSAVLQKDFFVVPKSYLTYGGNSYDEGVLRQTTDSAGKQITEFMPINIYYEADENIYLNPDVFKEGDSLVKPESKETFLLNKCLPLKGVYQINKGYAMFKQVQILCAGDEYYIVEEGNSYGLSNFDRIALDVSNIKENDIVFQ